jgi:hypothetical protein
MESKSVIKLQEAGYVFLRVEERKEDGKKIYIIKQSKQFGSWTYLERCKSMAACDRRMKELLNEDKYLY